MSDTYGADAPVYTYFNNDPGGAAVADAATFAALCRRHGLATTRTPSPSEARVG